MNCPCCGARFETTGGCAVCSLSTLWCICGQRFCARHGQKALEEHPCPNVQRIGVTVPASRPWTGERIETTWTMTP